MPALLLASSSPYRRELLARLRLPFQWDSPSVDEHPHPGEDATQLARRLSLAKASALASEYPDHLIIGSDQVAVCDGRLLGKPGHFEAAREQLRAASGNAVHFVTGLCLLNSRTGRQQLDQVVFTVHFRRLDERCIERYLALETPYDCAGSFKSEGLGIALFSRTEGDDATSLVGLPLIRLVDMLLAEGVAVPG